MTSRAVPGAPRARRLALLAALASALLAPGCAGEGVLDSTKGIGGCATNPAFAFDPRLACIQEMVLTPKCALSGCHAGIPQQGLNLSQGQTYTNTVGVASAEDPSFVRVAPGDPNASYLFLKITGDPRITLARMPLGRPALPAKEIAVIREWILLGAQDD